MPIRIFTLAISEEKELVNVKYKRETFAFDEQQKVLYEWLRTCRRAAIEVAGKRAFCFVM